MAEEKLKHMAARLKAEGTASRLAVKEKHYAALLCFGS